MADPLAGATIGGFTLLGRVDAGGMGCIYRARDEGGREVALKVMLSARSGAARDRFEREARVLAQLSHEGIVEHRSHGIDPVHGPYLAMEWLEGEDLAARLAREPLSVDETVEVARRTALALAYAHGRGVVHRDVKPANIFLVGRSANSVRILDFGIARAVDGAALTGTGAVIGTVGYMAPEQAEGRRDTDARADLFSLGCVLYECLTGAAAFAGTHVVAVLMKILLETPPRVRALRPDLPEALDALVASLLEKDPDGRPPSAVEVARALEQIGVTRGAPPTRLRTLAPSRSQEQRILQIVLVAPTDDGAALDRTMVAGDEVGDATVELDAIQRSIVAVERAAAHFGADVATLRNGMVLVTLAERGSARDRAEAAASVALAVLTATPAARIAVAAGRGDPTSSRVGGCVDRCVELLGRVAPGGVAIDDTTARLVEERFAVQAGANETGVLFLRGELREPRAERLVLGRSIRCVGRAKELALLDATIAECFDERVARSFVVVAGAGAGKSRVVRELLARRPPDERIILARGDALEAGSSLAIVRGLVRSAAELDAHADTDATVRALSRLIPGGTPRRVVELLAELLDRPVTTPETPELRAARADPGELRGWLQRSFLELCDALTAARPLLLVLDDLHWADMASVAWMAEALRRFHDRPLFVLAAARPEVDALFATPWPASQRLQLDPLSKRAAADLVRAALGDAANEGVVAEIVDRAQGNAFFLEELVRGVASGRSELPETVQAMVEARLLGLDPDARAALRAASVLGEACGANALAAVSLAPLAEARASLDALVEREMLHRERGERDGYGFRHAIVCDVAYAMIPREDLPALHARAAAWLLENGRLDPVALARHYDLAGDPVAATEHHVRAMEIAYAAGDFPETLARADVALGRDLEREQRARVQVTRGAVFLTQGSDAMLACSREAADLSPVGSPIWVRATGGIATGAAVLGRMPDLFEALAALGSIDIQPVATHGLALWNGCMAFVMSGQIAVVAPLVERIERGLAMPAPDPVFTLYANAALGLVAGLTDPPLAGGVARALALSRASSSLVHHTASPIVLTTTHLATAYAEWNVGDRERAQGAFEAVIEIAKRHRQTVFTLLASTGLVLLGPAPRDVEIPAVTTPAGHAVASHARGWIALERGDLEEAARLAEIVDGFAGVIRLLAPPTGCLLARIALRRGDLDGALASAKRAVASLRDNCCPLIQRAQAWQCLVETHRARGEHAEADAALAVGRERIVALADGLSDEDFATLAAAEPFATFEPTR